MTSNFVDHIKIYCRSGKGGAGSNHLHRAKYVPKGGADGGDGGRGGHVILKGNSHLWTLLHLRYTRHVKAENGKPGAGQQKSGSFGKDKVIEVPLGTIAKDAETDEVLAEITEHGQTEVIIEGGKGGLGNTHFKSSTNQTPRYAQPGLPGIEKSVILELKILADVGLVGFPNAGKSTLLSVVTAAKPKIADYPFTTLVPNLGIVPYRGHKSFAMADIPGIIEGAHKGKGIGHRFLRHIERNSILLFIIPVDAESIIDEYNILENELKQFNPELLDKERVLAVSKCDLLPEQELKKIKTKIPGIPCVFISSHTNMGLVELKDILWKSLNKDI